MKVGFKANWCVPWQKEILKAVGRGYILLRPIGANEKNLAEFLNKLQKWQDEKGELRELDISLEVHYQKRTLDMNALMWSLYEVIANELNNGKSWRDLLPEEREGFVSAENLYLEDLKEHAQIFSLTMPPDSVKWVKAEYRIFKEETLEDGNVKMYGYLSTSKMDTIQMSGWIDRLFRRLSNMGVHLDKGSDVVRYWEEYSSGRNPEDIAKIYYTGPEYKQHRPYCEATTQYLGDGGGSIAHIVARGMGRNPMEGKYLETEIMHLSDTAHALFDNGKGREHFVTKYPHLKKKIEYALNKQIETSQSDLFAPEDKQPEAEFEQIITFEARLLQKDIPIF